MISLQCVFDLYRTSYAFSPSLVSTTMKSGLMAGSESIWTGLVNSKASSCLYYFGKFICPHWAALTSSVCSCCLPQDSILLLQLLVRPGSLCHFACSLLWCWVEFLPDGCHVHQHVLLPFIAGSLHQPGEKCILYIRKPAGAISFTYIFQR